MPNAYLAIGTTAANMVNIETLMDYPAHALDNAMVPLLGPFRRRTLAQSLIRNGSIDSDILFDIQLAADLESFIKAEWGDYFTAGVSKYVSWLTEDGHYSPHLVTLERPVIREHYDRVNDTWVQRVRIPGLDWQIQIDTVNTSGSVSTGQRYVQSDTTSGAVTLDLPAVGGVVVNTIYSYEKTGGGNALTLDGDSSEEIDGSTTLIVTGRTDIYTDGTAWYSL